MYCQTKAAGYLHFKQILLAAFFYFALPVGAGQHHQQHTDQYHNDFEAKSKQRAAYLQKTQKCVARADQRKHNGRETYDKQREPQKHPEGFIFHVKMIETA